VITEKKVKLFHLHKMKAQRFHEQGQAMSDKGQVQEAISAYLTAIELDPNKSESFYNLGLIYKYRNDWSQSLEFNMKAHALNPDDEATCWNLAIAATALHRWDIARSAWQACGIQLEGDCGPITMNFGMTPLRLNPDGTGEVVWGTRIDPVRAKIDNVPYPESGFHYGDVVLHDGAAVGYRVLDGREYPVFNVLELFERSNFTTATAKVVIASDDDLTVLEQLFSETEHYFEDWSASTRILCRQCSEGIAHEHFDEIVDPAEATKRTLGIAVFASNPVLPIFDKWQLQTDAKLESLDR
jgi:tetratricopeptide (TPR) repeat protein